MNIANALQAAVMPGTSQVNATLSGTTLAGTSLSTLPSNSRRYKKPASSSTRAPARVDDDIPEAIRAKSPADLSNLARQKSPFFEVHLREADQQGSHQPMALYLAEHDQSRSHSVDETNLQSRDFSVLDQEVAAEEVRQRAQEAPRPTKILRRKQHHNDDNKLYKPVEEDEDDEDSDDESSHTRRKKKIPGRATLDGSLPTVGTSKKRKSHGPRKSISSRNRGPDEPSIASDGSIRPSPQQDDAPNGDVTIDDTFDESLKEIHDVSMMAAPDEPSNIEAPGFGIGQFFGVVWLGLATAIYAVCSAVAVILREGTSLVIKPFLWARINGRALLLVAGLGALIAYQAFAPTYEVVPGHPTRGSLFSSIFGRTPRPYVPSGSVPDNWAEFTSQLATMQAELASISKSLHSSDQSSAIRAVERQIDQFGRRYKDVEGRLDRALEEMHQSLEAASRRKDDSTAVNQRFAKIEVTLERLQEALRQVETIAETSPTHIRELEKKVAAISKAQTRTPDRSPKDVSPAAAEYFQSLLNRAFNDRIALPDYAIFSGGGRIIPTLTSPTYEIPGRRSWMTRILGLGGNGAAYQGRPPATALTPDINIGNCWPFAGSKGHIGVFLSRHITISSVTVDHASRHIAYDISPAPKLVRVWGVVDGEDNLAKLQAYRDELTVRKDIGALSSEEEDELAAAEPARLPHELKLLQIATFKYDVNAVSNIQTFEVAERIQRLGIDIGVVLFDIQSNHGNEEYTCLYRVRVHGTPRALPETYVPTEETNA